MLKAETVELWTVEKWNSLWNVSPLIDDLPVVVIVLIWVLVDIGQQVGHGVGRDE